MSQPPSALVPSGSNQSNPSFAQQGSVDWVSLSNVTATFTIGLLARLSQAGVDPLTFSIAPVVCSHFNQSTACQKEIQDELAKLKSFAFIGDVAYFGFGLQSLTRRLATTEQGLAFVSLAGCMHDSYGSLFSARVFRELLKGLGVPSGLTPSIGQWQALVGTCAGIFSRTKFSVLIQGFRQLLIPRAAYGVPDVEATGVKSMAEALRVLAEVSRGVLKGCTYAGGVDCAWLAALAEFAFHFNVSVRTSEGEVLYQTSRANDFANEASPEITFLASANIHPEVKAIQKVFMLSSGQDLFNVEPAFRVSKCRFRLPSQWSEVIADAFGDANATRLLQGTIGEAFARLLALLAYRGEAGRQTLSDDRHVPWPLPETGNMLERLDCREYIDFAARQLPELKPAIDTADLRDLASISEQEAISYVNTISAGCRCELCFEGGSSTQGFCLKFMAVTIIHILNALFRVTVDDVLPSAYAFRQLYRQSAYDSGRLPVDLVEKTSQIFSVDEEQPYELTQRVGRLAHCGSGVCVFYEILRNMTCPSLTTKVHVMPGYISYENSIFSTIIDDNLPEEEWSTFRIEPLTTFSLVATETMRSRILAVACQAEGNRIAPPVLIRVGEIVRCLNVNKESCYRNVCTDDIFFPEQSWLSQGLRIKWKVVFPGPSHTSTAAQPQSQEHGQACSSSSACSLLCAAWGSQYRDLRVYKLATSFWERQDADMFSILAELARPWRRQRYIMVHVSDCPRCIMQSISQSDLLGLAALHKDSAVPGTIAGEIVVTDGAFDIHTFRFEVRRELTALPGTEVGSEPSSGSR